MSPDTADPILIEYLRGELVESGHRGALAIADSTGILESLGDLERPRFPRSAWKPFQALAVFETGVDEQQSWSAEERAIVCASHHGAPEHVRAVRSLLHRNGLREDQLACGRHPPLDPDVAATLRAEGREPDVSQHNCAGKHTGMLILSRQLGAPTTGYEKVDHPAQQRIAATIAELLGRPASTLQGAIDGCSAPAFTAGIGELARAAARLADATGFAEPRRRAIERMWSALNEAPHHLAGRGAIDRALIRAGGGDLIAKRGAEGVLLVSIRANARRGIPLGVAIKIADGSIRALAPLALALLKALGFPRPDDAHLPRSAATTLHNHAGIEVGSVRTSTRVNELLRHLRERLQ